MRQQTFFNYDKEKLKDAISKYEQSIRYLETQIQAMEKLIRDKMSGKKGKLDNVISYLICPANKTKKHDITAVVARLGPITVQFYGKRFGQKQITKLTNSPPTTIFFASSRIHTQMKLKVITYTKYWQKIITLKI